MKKQTKPLHPFIRARRAAVPILIIESYDPAATIADCVASLNGSQDETPLLIWDCASALREVTSAVDGRMQGNPAGKAWLAMLPDEVKAACASPMFPQTLLQHPPIFNDVPGAVFALNMHQFIGDPNRSDPGTIQAIWNIRDAFKANGCTLVLIGCSAKLPPELKNDVPTFAEPIPDEPMISDVIDSILGDAEIDAGKVDKAKVTDGLLGYLSRFSVEQSLALSLEPDGVDLDQLWDLKVAALKATAGLEITRPKLTFADLKGSAGSIDLLNKLLHGKRPPRAVLQLDEIEKMIAGSAGDLSGTTQGLLEQFLTWTEERNVQGILLTGIPGAGKSLTCKCTAGEANVPLLRASMSTVKGSLVGQSEGQMKALLAAVDAVGQGRVLLLSTSNSFESLPPEVIARHRIGVLFYDYPQSAESKSIWQYYLRKYEIKDDKIPPSQNWVGREIASCCERAWLFDCSLAEAAKSVVPVCTANAGKMDALRRSVSGRFLSASHPGLFNIEIAQSTGRKIEV